MPNNTYSLALHAMQVQKHIRIARACAKLPANLAYIAAERLIPSGGHLLFNENEQKDAIQKWREITKKYISENELWLSIKSNHSTSLLHAAWYRHKIKNILNSVTTFDEAWPDISLQLSKNKNGALILTLHNDVHHSLCAVIAQLTHTPVWMIAMTENSSPMYPWLKKELHQMHTDCATQMHGGGFLFIESQKNRQRIKDKLNQKNIVVSMHDTTAPPGTRPFSIPLFDRQLEVPIGAVELATHLGCPIYFAALAWRPTQRTYHLVCQQLPNHDPSSTLHAYASAITELVRKSPWAWSGWQWFHNMPPLRTPVTPPPSSIT